MLRLFSRFCAPVCLFLLCGWFVLPAAAFDLGLAFEAAKVHSADYAAARHARDAEIEQKHQARAPLLPQLSANASHVRQPASLSANTVSHGWNVQVSQVLFDKAAWAQYRQGALAAELGQARLQEAERQLLLEVAQAYFDVLLYQDQLAAVREERAAYAQQQQQARAMFEKGAATIVDAHEAQAGFDAALAKEITLLSQLQVARQTFADRAGLDASKIQPLRRQAQPFDLLAGSSVDEWQALARAQNAEWRLQRLELAQAEQAVTLAKGGYWPRLTLSGGYQDNHNTQEYNGLAQRYRSKGASLNLQLNVPLYSGGQTASRVREATARALQQQELLNATERRIELAVRQAYRQTADYHYRILAQQRLLESSNSKLESVRLGRRVGVRSNLDELQAVQARAEAEQKLAEARYGQVLAYLQLLASAGVLDEEARWRWLRERLY